MNQFDELRDTQVQERQRKLNDEAQRARLAAECPPGDRPNAVQRVLDKAGDLLIAAGTRLKQPNESDAVRTPYRGVS